MSEPTWVIEAVAIVQHGAAPHPQTGERGRGREILAWHA
jgi:hypothetical protein